MGKIPSTMGKFASTIGSASGKIPSTMGKFASTMGKIPSTISPENPPHGHLENPYTARGFGISAPLPARGGKECRKNVERILHL